MDALHRVVQCGSLESPLFGNLTVQRKSRRLPFPVTVLSCCLLAAALFVAPAMAANGPLAEFVGSWSGAGTLRPANGAAERIRCKAEYRQLGTSQHEINLHLRCASDSYNFDLSGDFTADEQDHVSGQWTERSRNIGGIAIGNAQGDRLQLHVESSAFSAEMVMVTRGRRQSVTLESRGGGQVIKASITLGRH
jgi:hypothetical protein